MTKARLEVLNALRSKVNKRPIKAWKGSKAKLEQEIAKLSPREKIGIVELARQLKMDPKVARAKARRHVGNKGPRWVITQDNVDDFVAMLKRDHRLKPENNDHR